MEMNEKVLTALEVLRDSAENDFELHRIEVLINDLTAPPVAEQIDENHQKFLDKVYHKDRDGYYITTRYDSIHRAVYRYYCGDIPKGYEIHHDDQNPSNNQIDNLVLLTKSQHAIIHRGLQKIVRTCLWCGKELKNTVKKSAECCSASCTNRLNYFNKTGRTSATIEKACVVCGKKFVTSSRNCSEKGRTTCSTECWRKLRKNIFVEYNGAEVCLKDAAKLSGISYKTLLSRYQRGKRGEDLFKPVKN